MALVRDGLGESRFAWAGGHAGRRGFYYRIHGPRILIEFDNTQKQRESHSCRCGATRQMILAATTCIDITARRLQATGTGKGSITMKQRQNRLIKRRDLLIGAGLALPLFASVPLRAETVLTPACGDAAVPTASQMEGPFLYPGYAAEGRFYRRYRTRRGAGAAGVRSYPSCQPVAGALVDLWHADRQGRYDNSGFVLRGHQITDAAGRYRFMTCTPGDYPGRARHFHVKVRAPKGPLLDNAALFPG